MSFFRRTEQERIEPAPGLSSGKQVGDFRLLSLIGQGGMGQVWEAEQCSLKRRVAVKFVRPERVTTHQLELFAREARAGGRLSHPGIVSIYGHGESDGLAWIAMEFVSGAWTLDDFLHEAARQAEVPADYDRHVARLVAEIAEAMQAAHEAAVIHRDLKPQNVLITRDDHPKVTDFGLARITDEVALSVTGDFAGTYFYMSPEQALAKRIGIDHRTDIFSLGAVLYELLALRRPFEGDTSHQITEQIVYRDPPELRTIRSKIPRDLAVITGKALEKERERRFQSMSAFAADLRRYLANEPIQARPPTAADRVRKWVKRNPGRSSAAAIAALAFSVIAWLLVANVRANRALEGERANLAQANSALEGKTLESEQRRADAERAATREKARADEVLRLSAFQQLDDLVREAGRLWPITPELGESYARWLTDARTLVSALPSHRATLEEVRARGTPSAEAGAENWSFASSEDRWWHGQLMKLIRALEAFANPDSGLFSAGISPEHGWGIQRRLDFAREMGERSVDGAQARKLWAAASASIRNTGECPWYHGLELAPQPGMLPVGQDPDSGLWEFALLVSGEVPERGADGRLVLAPDAALILVLLPGGTFWMGAQKINPGGQNYDPEALPDESPPHQVRLSPFFLSKYEMTQAQWQNFTGRELLDRWGPRHPVTNVSWVQGNEVCRRMGLSLPSEAQWEYGARGGTDTPWWSGTDPSVLAEVANLSDQYLLRQTRLNDFIAEAWDDGAGLPCMVGRYAPNPFGLYDVYGNLWEWCLDPYIRGYANRSSGNEIDPIGNGPGDGTHVFRGGCYATTSSVARSAKRWQGQPEFADQVLGLRPARGLTP